ncbi:hypothetical protein L228DRAFT_241602 [Xylona heveae TC161]|uniref:Uncharacterized protein n=1 Tax=Xylona heveae (strain CBS 132557 / TC161) TaxID=1328760 RepID=A0A164ZQ22_XYLHT|nr:hypothetical protein L228DRAFT_241602 [Xylona heveae TC161]KZF19362.1 hypothetical protein L228DRAFT_241602 [Xylona heveae TC161]
MSAFYFGAQNHLVGNPSHAHSHHGGRSRRAPRLPASQNSHKQFRAVRNVKEIAETPSVTAFRARFEAGRSFDLDDDLEFCPGLLTEDDLQSIHSASSDRSSLSSGSPDSSPLQHQIQPTQQVTPTISLSTASSPFIPTAYQPTAAQMKLHQPAAVRTRNAIPIVNPTTGMRVASPPLSVSPARMQQHGLGRRW